MIKASHNRFFDSVFGTYLNIHMRLAFKKVIINSRFKDSGGPVVLIGNHFSWWDGFIARHVNREVLHRRLHLMMQEDQLSKRTFLSKLGAFSIKKNSRSASISLQYATELLKDPENLLILFPQGRFQTLHQHPVAFEKGWFRILKHAPRNTQVVFMASLVDYFASPRPHLTVYLEKACSNPEQIVSADEVTGKPQSFADASAIEDAYNKFLERCIAAQNLKA